MMTRKQSPSVRTTLYRLVELGDLTSAIKPKYLKRDEFAQNGCDRWGARGTGRARNRHTAWGSSCLTTTRWIPAPANALAIRTADGSALNSVTRTTLDYRSRTDRFSIPSGEHLRGFRVGDFGELVTRLVARARIEGLTAGEDDLGVRGADALSVRLACAPEALIADLDVIDSVLAKDAPSDLAILEQLVAIKHQPDLIARLEGRERRRTAILN